jgi:choline-sulfatase
MYEESARVPLLMRVPFRRLRPHRVPTPVSHIDLVPTMLDLLGHRAAAEPLPGKSLVPLLEGKPAGSTEVFLEWTGDGGADGPNARTVVTGEGEKLVLHDKDSAMLFDLRRDPLETHNLAARPAYAPAIARLRKRLDAWQRRTGDTLSLG